MPKCIAQQRRPSTFLSLEWQCRRLPTPLRYADEFVSSDEKFRFQRGRIPDASSNKMTQLIIITGCKSLCHRRNALAIAWADQPRDVKRTHPLPRLVPQTLKVTA
jgi:hypothetical protein